jgi:hypothetical protein
MSMALNSLRRKSDTRTRHFCIIKCFQDIGCNSRPSDLFINAATIDKELQVDYDSDNQSFKFKLKGKDESGTNNDQLITDFE